MLAIVQHEAARRDLIQHFVYLAENASNIALPDSAALPIKLANSRFP